MITDPDIFDMIFVYICRFSLYVTFYFHNVKHEILVKRWNLGVPGGQILLRGQNLWVTSIWTRLESHFFGIQKWENWYKIHQDTRICQFIGCPENPSFVFYDPKMSEVSWEVIISFLALSFFVLLLQLFDVEKASRPRLAKLSRVQSSETIGVDQTWHVYNLDGKLLKIYSPEN